MSALDTRALHGFVADEQKMLRAQLSDAQVRAIRDAAGEGLTQEVIAEHFGVSRGNVSKIINRRSYTHV